MAPSNINNLLTDKLITASCIITEGAVFKNEHSVFENRDATLQDLLLAVYKGFELAYPKFYKMDNLCKLGWLAAEVLLQNTDLNNRYRPAKIGLVIANANSSLDNDIKYQQTISDVPSPSVFVYTLPNIVIGEICIRNNFKGEHAFFIQENFDAKFIHQQVSYLLDQGILDACICGWAEVLGQNYKAALFLIERAGTQEHSLEFTPQNMTRIFDIKN